VRTTITHILQKCLISNYVNKKYKWINEEKPFQFSYWSPSYQDEEDLVISQLYQQVLVYNSSPFVWVGGVVVVAAIFAIGDIFFYFYLLNSCLCSNIL
jgi:hypothetical protein